MLISINCDQKRVLDIGVTRFSFCFLKFKIPFDNVKKILSSKINDFIENMKKIYIDFVKRDKNLQKIKLSSLHEQ